MKREFEDKEARLKHDIANLEEESRDMAHDVTSSNPYFDSFRRHRNITELNRGIVAELINTTPQQETSRTMLRKNHISKFLLAFSYVSSRGAV